MEDGDRVSRHAQSHCHVTELWQSWISHHALDVVLHNAQETHEQCSDWSNDQNKWQSGIRQLKQWWHTAHHENTSCHHRCCVNQSRNWRWAFHRVWQPNVQWELCRLTHRANEQANASHCDQIPISARQDLLNQQIFLCKHTVITHAAGVSQ